MLQDFLVLLFAEDYAREVSTHSLNDREITTVDLFPERDDFVDLSPLPPSSPWRYASRSLPLILGSGVVLIFSAFGFVSFLMLVTENR